MRDILRAHGYEARRDGRLDTDVVHDMHGYHIEVKRRERYEIDKWIEQAERDAGDETPIVVFRKSNQKWRAIIDFDYLVGIITNQGDRSDATAAQPPSSGPVSQDPRA